MPNANTGSGEPRNYKTSRRFLDLDSGEVRDMSSSLNATPRGSWLEEMIAQHFLLEPESQLTLTESHSRRNIIPAQAAVILEYKSDP